jgi:hypothetical protein
MKNLNQDNWYPGRDSKPEHTEYEAEVSVTRS